MHWVKHNNALYFYSYFSQRLAQICTHEREIHPGAKARQRFAYHVSHWYLSHCSSEVLSVLYAKTQNQPWQKMVRKGNGNYMGLTATLRPASDAARLKLLLQVANCQTAKVQELNVAISCSQVLYVGIKLLPPLPHPTIHVHGSFHITFYRWGKWEGVAERNSDPDSQNNVDAQVQWCNPQNPHLNLLGTSIFTRKNA